MSSVPSNVAAHATATSAPDHPVWFHPLSRPLLCCIRRFPLHFSLFPCFQTFSCVRGELAVVMEALGAAGVCIGDWVEQSNKATKASCSSDALRLVACNTKPGPTTLRVPKTQFVLTQIVFWGHEG